MYPDKAEINSDAFTMIKGSQHHHQHVAHPHDDITTFAIIRDKPLAAVTLSLFLEALADHCGSDLLRLKGLICIAENETQPAVIHGVQHVFHPPVWLDRWPSEDRRTRLVFIGRGISDTWVRALIDAIEAEVEELATSRDAGTEPKLLV
jgi:G3E family GTPase